MRSWFATGNQPPCCGFDAPFLNLRIFGIMIKFLPLFIPAIFISGCGASYHYYAPPANNNPFANKNEAHFSGHAGISGSALGFGYALADKAALAGAYHVSSPLKYHGSELEAGLMLGNPDSLHAGKRTTITFGCGFGSNYEKTPEAAIKNFRGNYVKPFAMLTFGSAHKSSSLGPLFFADGAFSLKINYLHYDGFKATTLNNIPSEKKFNTAVFFAEPYFNFNLGLKWLRIDLGLGAVLKKKYEFDKNIAVFPIEANAGILFILGRKSIEKKE